MKEKTKLLASASSWDDLKEMIAKFYCTKADCVSLGNEYLKGTKRVFLVNPEKSHAICKRSRVVLKGARWRFEFLVD